MARSHSPRIDRQVRPTDTRGCDLRTGFSPSDRAGRVPEQVQRNIHAGLGRHAGGPDGRAAAASGNTSFLTGTSYRPARASAPHGCQSDMVASIGGRLRGRPRHDSSPLVLRWIPNVPARPKRKPDTAGSAKAGSATAALARAGSGRGWKKVLATRRAGCRVGTGLRRTVRSPGSRSSAPRPLRRPPPSQRRPSRQHRRSVPCTCPVGVTACCSSTAWPAIRWN